MQNSFVLIYSTPFNFEVVAGEKENAKHIHTHTRHTCLVAPDDKGSSICYVASCIYPIYPIYIKSILKSSQFGSVIMEILFVINRIDIFKCRFINHRSLN